MKNEFKVTSRADFFDYEAEVMQAWNSFPGSKRNVHFIDASNWRVFSPHGSSLAKAMFNIVWRRNLAAIRSAFESADNGNGANSMTLGDDETGRLVCLVTAGALKERYLHSSASEAQERALVFDHEFSHAITPDGMAEGTKSESLGDAYAVIRHLQRFGPSSRVIEALVANRSFQLVFREQGYGRDHFTSPVVAKILEQRYTVAWNSLTPQQTVELAQKFVRESVLDVKTVDKLDDEFKEFHGKAQDIENGDIAPVKALADKLIATNSADVFKYGMLALQACRDKKGIAVALKGMQQQLADKQKAFSQPNSVPANRKSSPEM